MKRSKVYIHQCNVKVEQELKDDLVYLDKHKVDVAELLRPVIRAKVAEAKKKLTDKAG